MPDAASRRDLLKLGLAGAATLAIPAGVSAMAIEDEIEKELGHPLPAEAKKLLKNALDANRNNSVERLKTKLPDCSEPCFTYRPTQVERPK